MILRVGLYGVWECTVDIDLTDDELDDSQETEAGQAEVTISYRADNADNARISLPDSDVGERDGIYPDSMHSYIPNGLGYGASHDVYAELYIMHNF